MTTLHLVVKEIGQRKVNFTLSLLGVTVAVALFVFFFTTGEASRRETTRLMRDMGFNLRIIPKDADMGAFLLQGFAEETMPEDYVERLAGHRGPPPARLVGASLQRP